MLCRQHIYVCQNQVFLQDAVAFGADIEAAKNVLLAGERDDISNQMVRPNTSDNNNEPFVKAANNLGMTEDELFAKMKHYESIGVLRRFAAILRHRQVGFTANGMIVWKVPEDRITSVGETLGSFPQVSHCYERPTYDDWPYNVFSMIHCKTQDEANDVAKTIQNQINVDEFRILFSSREFKKTRVEYFVENSFSHAKAKYEVSYLRTSLR